MFLKTSNFFQVDRTLLFVRKLPLFLLESPLELVVIRLQVAVERSNFLRTELYPVKLLEKSLRRNLSFFHDSVDQVLVQRIVLENV